MKITYSSLLLSAFIFAGTQVCASEMPAPNVPQPAAAAATENGNEGVSESEKKQMVDASVALIEEMYKLSLETKDAESAKKLLEHLEKLVLFEKKMSEKYSSLKLKDCADEKTMEKLEQLVEKITEEMIRMNDDNFYDNEELAEKCRDLIGLPENKLLREASQDVVDKLCKERSEIISRISSDFDALLDGGPGFTRETAWKLTLDTPFAVRFQYLVLSRLNLGEREVQALIPEDGRYYDRHTITVKVGEEAYTVYQWFDITPYYTALQSEVNDEDDAEEDEDEPEDEENPEDEEMVEVESN